MTKDVRVLYVTSWVLGDAGANAAEIFPRLSAADEAVSEVIVADFPKNKHHIKHKQGAEFLRLPPERSWLLNAVRIARKAKQKDIDFIHVFYRQQNAVLLIYIRVFLTLIGGRTKLIMDHRSVNLAKGWRRRRKMLLNQLMQAFTHHLAGNPWAVETNHFWVFRPKHIIDLGYDRLPAEPIKSPTFQNSAVTVWYIGSLKPRNRKTEFLLEVMRHVSNAQRNKKKPGQRDVLFQVAGPANCTQRATLEANPDVIYHGSLPRDEVYKKLRDMPGIGLAFMNHEFHEFAPSLKFAEYSIMRFKILASDTQGLRTQAERMNMDSIEFVPEDTSAWANAILGAAQKYKGLSPMWPDANQWSYPNIFKRQVLQLYKFGT